MPYVTLKAAVTLDGRMATRSGDSRWITGEAARKHAHRLRDRSDAVMVGVGTVLADDPELTVRHVQGRDPIRVVLDSGLRTPPDAQACSRGTSRAPTWIFHAPSADRGARAALSSAAPLLMRGAAARARRSTSTRVLRELARRDVVRLLVEGGPTLHGALLDAGLVDYAAVFVAPRILGDAQALPLALGRARERMSEALAHRLRPRAQLRRRRAASKAASSREPT